MNIEIWIAGALIVVVSWWFGYSEGWSRGADWWHRLRARAGVDLCPRCYVAERERRDAAPARREVR